MGSRHFLQTWAYIKPSCAYVMLKHVAKTAINRVKSIIACFQFFYTNNVMLQSALTLPAGPTILKKVGRKF